nr:protein NTM1-like 9 [Ipomoea trifida]GLL29693.1 protein NTM1-like 9 [Ipomoea trifida]
MIGDDDCGLTHFLTRVGLIHLATAMPSMRNVMVTSPNNRSWKEWVSGRHLSTIAVIKDQSKYIISNLDNPSKPVTWRFHPTNEELINHYLKLKINGLKAEVSVIRKIDIWKLEL